MLQSRTMTNSVHWNKNCSSEVSTPETQAIPLRHKKENIIYCNGGQNMEKAAQGCSEVSPLQTARPKLDMAVGYV